MTKRSEFELIADYFAPLTRGGVVKTGRAFELTDDAAVLSCEADEEWVVTKDAIVEGVHYLPDDPPDSVAKKLLRVNLSDLAAKGARPVHYVMAAGWPRDVSESWIAEFARGLAQDQEEFGIFLLGGDTVSAPSAAFFSLTAFGSVKRGRMIRRSGAKPGHRLYISGTIGDAHLGLKLAQNALDLPDATEAAELIARYRVPRPRLDLIDYLQAHAAASIDVSDGLLADLAHLAEASGVGARIEREAVPLSVGARAALELDLTSWDQLLSGGDDYEVLFAAPPLAEVPKGVAEIGECLAEPGLWSGSGDGPLQPLKPAGFSHF